MTKIHYLDPIFTSASPISGQTSGRGMQNTLSRVCALTKKTHWGKSQKTYLELEFGAHIWWFSSAGEYFETV